MKHNYLPRNVHRWCTKFLKRHFDERFLIAEEIGLESPFLKWGKPRTYWSMTVTNSPKEVSLPQIYFEHWQLTRINYVEIICHIYLCPLFVWTLRWVTDIYLNGCIMWFWWPTNNANIWWFHIYECALSALPKGFSLRMLECKKKNKLS